MKRRVLSFVIALALCLDLCPTWAWAAGSGADGGLCPHHPAHTDACGYREPSPKQECTHAHDDGCYSEETNCVHIHTAECGSDPDFDPGTDEPDACTHICTEDSGCVTRALSCPHVHDEACGYAPADPGAACGFACRICPIEELIGGLPSSVSASTREQVQARIDEICALYDGLTAVEQRQVDLSRCEALQERINELGTVGIVDEPPAISSSVSSETMTKDDSITKPRVISYPFLLNTAGFTLTNTAANAAAASAIRVTGTGELYLLGIVTSQKGAGVEVQSGGFLNVTGENTVITGKTYALDIAAGARVELAAGTYTGGAAAINLAEGDFAALLAQGCAFYDENGSAILAENAGTAKTLVVRQCTDHANKTYTANAGTITHTWTCQVCKATGTEQCTFTFDENGKGICGLCGNEVTVTVDRDSLKELAYDTSNSGNVQPENGTVIVTAKNGTTLTQGTDYTVEYSVHADVGNTSVTVTVTVVMGTDTDNGTFTKGYTFTKDELTRPVLEWDTAGPVTVSYDGAPVEASELPPVTIHINSNVDLHQYLQYSYKVQGDTAYTDGLPTNAGTYNVVVSLPERPEVPELEAASSEPITLIINKISPIAVAPVAAKPTYNREAQELATSGTLCDPAVKDGAQILFTTAENGNYSTNIPTGINAGTNYTVWYKVDVPAACAGNYNAVGPTQISGVEIKRKPTSPIVTLSDYKYLYDGGWKEPKVEVKDDDDMTVLLDTEYSVAYANNKDVGTATVTVSDKPGGNYAIDQVEVEFKITSREQATLSITNKPDTVTYGQAFTLSTLGGSGSGNVTWEVVTDSANDGSATINRTSGRVRITGAGTVTVKATKSGKDPVTGVTNYNDAIATWTFTADKKAVIATVTAEDKTYDGDDEAKIHAVVEEGVLSGDEITINGLEGAFSDGNAGVDKTVKVTVDPSKVTITGKNSQHYEVSYSSLTVTATIHKAIAAIKTAPDAANLTYDGNAQALIDASNLLVDPSGILVEYAMSKDGPYSTDIPKATNAGAYTVWYRVQETPNYTGLPPEKVEVTIAKKPVNPVITLSGDGLSTDSASASPMQFYIYDGTAKTPDVKLTEADGTTIIPYTEYTVSYSNNTDVGTATVTVTAKDDGNYSFSDVSKNFRIDKKKAVVTTAPKMAGDPLTYTGRAQQLVTEGAGSGGTMFYALKAADGTKTFSETIPTAINADDYTVYYKVKGDGNHSDSDEGQVTVTIAPKTVKDPTIELLDESGAPLVNYTYDGNPKMPTVVVKDGSTVIGDDVTGENDEYNVIYTNNVDAGTATVNITDKTGGNYTVTGSATFVIVKADIVFNPAPKAASITYDGQPHELLIPGTTSGGTVQYALNSPNTTFSDAIPQATAAGKYTVYYKVIGDKNHNDLNDLTTQFVNVTIQRKPLTAITIELAPESFVYDGKAHLPEITVKDGKTVLPEEEYTWKCTQSGGAEIAAPTSQGTYTITIEDAPNGNYDLSRVTANTKTFTIGKAAQAELVIGGKPSATNYGDTFTLSVSGGSSTSAVTWKVEKGPATIDNNGAVKITGVGEVTITATNPGDQNYESVSAQWSFTAAPKPVTASVTVQNKDYDGTTDATVDSAGIDNADLVNSGDDVTIDKTSITAEFDTASVGTGKTVTLDTSKVKVSGTDAAKYAISYPSTVTADITQATTSITTAPVKIDPLTYTGQPQALVTPGKSNVGFIVYSLNGTDFSPEIPTGTNAGTYNIYYKVDGTSDYTGVDVNTVPLTVTIDPKTITPVIEPEESSYLYDGAKHEPKITVKDGKTVIDEDQYTIIWTNDDTAITDDILTAAGSYTATITNVSGGNYSFTATATVEIVPASQAALNITGQPEHVYYGDTITTLSTSGGSGNGKVTWSIKDADASAKSTIDPDTGELTVKDTGSITVKAERTVPNYGPVSDTWTFTVEPKPVTAVVTVAAKDYDGTTDIANGAITAVVKNSDLVDPANDSITISGLTGAYTNANAGKDKTVTLDASKATTTADTNKYTVSYPATAKADINRRTVTVTIELSGNDLDTDTSFNPPKYSYEYDGTEKTPTVTVTGEDADNSYTATLAASDYTVSYADNKNVGSATVTVTSAEGGNYLFDDETVTFEIKSTAAKLTSTPQAKRLTYDGTPQDLVTVGTATGGTVVYSLSPIDADDEDTYSENIPQGQNAGVYTVYYMVKGDGNHEDTAPGQVSVTIDPKEITPKITLNTSGPFEYSGSAHEPTITVEDGAVTIPANEYTVSYRDNINAGTATVIVSNKNGGNYIVNGTAEFTITKAAPTVTDPTANPGLKYTGALQDLVTAGVTSHGTVVYSVNGGNYSAAVPAASAVGQYTIDYKVLGDDNHSDTAPATLNVSIAKNTVSTPTISLSADTFKYNGSQQKPTIIVYDDSGAVIPEREYVVTITGVKSNNMVDVDTYTVMITTPSTSNYEITTSNTRTFKIVPADQETISITGTQAKVSYGDTIQLGTTGGTGTGTVTWTVTGTSGTTIKSTVTAGGLLTVKDVGGPITVTAKRSMGSNYGDVSATWEFSAGKRQVTAVVTAADRNYIAGDTTATVTATVPGSELVSGDSITITGLTGAFDDDSVGTNKKVTIDSSSASVSGTNWENYDITYPITTTASILAAAATVDTGPQAVSTLTYDASQSQALVTAGTATGGTMVYSLDGTNFTPVIPKAKDAGDYTVYFKAKGDGNHTDSAVGTVLVTIDKQTVVTPQIELNPPTAPYDGKVKRPEVAVLDGANNVIPASEYKVTYVNDNGENWTDQGTYTVKVEDITGGNYIVTTATADFTISTTAQNPLEIVNKPGLVYYGDTFTLSATGGSGSGAVTWSVDNESVVKIDGNGLVEIVGKGQATITATRPGGGNYDDATATYSLNALAKPITAIVTAEDRVYASGNTTATIHVTWKDGDLVGEDSLDTSRIEGTFANDSVGTNKTVTISGTVVNDSTAQKYDITIPATTTASILKADAVAPSVSAVSGLVYTSSAQNLVTGGDANTLYSDSRDGVYSTTVPTGTNAGTYTVWYKAKGDADHNDSEPQSVTVTISRKTLTVSSTNATLSGSDLQTDTDGTYYYEYDGTEKKPSVIIEDGGATVPASEYTVSYSDNKNVGDATVTITSNEGGNYDVSGSVTFEIREGTAELIGSPQAKDLTYTGQPQELVTVGTASGGHIEYMLLDKDGNGSYSKDIPAETGAGTYMVYYKVVGDSNHADSATTGSVTVTIKPKEIVSPKVTVNGTYTYNGNAQEPTGNSVEVVDGTTPIPSSEYTLSYRDNTDAGTATVIITNANGGNYIVNGTGTFTIGKAELAAADITPPTSIGSLPYNGTAQALVKAGNATGGTMVYSLSKAGDYSPAIPTAKDMDTYTVWYKVQGDANHNDTEPQSVSASIIANAVSNPTIQVEPAAVKYTGEKQEPTVTVRDDNGVLIDGSEYEAAYADKDGNPVTNLTNVGKYTVTITEVSDGNYTFDTTDGKNTATFEILAADQEALAITGTRERVYYGDTIQLDTTGGNGTVAWTVNNDASTIATISNDGLLKITGVGSVTVTATSTATGYTDQTATWRLYADKKPVTAVVTAQSKDYDTTKTATVTAALQASDLVGSDVIKITLSGEFEDPNAGTDKKVIVNSSSPNFDGSSGTPGNYNITYPATTTASILKANIDTANDVTAPTAADAADLVYTGNPLALVKAGTVTGGTMEYSTDGINFSASLPTGTNAGDYDVWYRVKGDGNHNDIAAKKLDGKVTISKQTVTSPTIEFTPSGASYDGQEHKPTVTVKDANGRIIPDTEYTVTYGDTDWKTAGAHAVTITSKTGGNYDIKTATKDFTILAMGQNPLSIGNLPGRVQYGDTFTLSATGGSGTGAVTWESSNPTVATVDINSGLVTVVGCGRVEITATKAADGNYGAATATWTFSAEKKAVTPIVTADDKVYDTTTNATIHVTWKDGDLVGNDTISADHLTAAFASADVGTNKVVNITGTLSHSNYVITLPTVRASITPKTASVTGVTAILNLVYDRTAKALVNEGTATGGTVVYSLDGVNYTPNVPTGTNAGAYTVWYKVEADTSGNYKDSTPARVVVNIAQKTVNPTIELDPDTFEYDSTAKKPDVTVKDGSNIIPASEYTVSYSNNTAVGTAAKVTIDDAPGGNYMVSGTKTFTITAGAAKLTGAPQAKNLTYNGNPQELVTDGTAVNGEVVYSLTGNGSDYTSTIPTGTNAGTYSVYYKVEGANGAADTAARTIYVTIQPKPVNNPEILLDLEEDTVPYTGAAHKPEVLAVVDGNKPIPSTEYTVTYRNNTKVGTATVYVISKSSSNYSIYATTTFEIVKEAAKFTANPTGKALSYDGTAQELLNAGTVEGGTAFYSLDGVTYSGVIPTGTETKQYTVFAKVVGDSTHADSDPVTITAEIKANEPKAPTVVLTGGNSFSYTGGEIKPTVTVYDDSNKVIPATEYTVSYSNNTNVGTATVTVTSSGKNYSFTANTTFGIVNAGQPQLEITGKKDAVYYGDTLSLGTTGGSGSGAVSWTVSGPADKLSDGQFKITGSGMVTITATKAASTGYAEATATWTFPAKAKPVEAIVTAADKDYDGGTDATLTVAYDGLLSGDNISGSVTATGQFTDARVGAGKTVIVTLTVPTSVSEKYEISYPKTITASITQAAPEVTAPTVNATPLTYNGAEQALLATVGTATGGNIMYSLDGGVTYSYTAPKAKDAGAYDVWYKVVASDTNYRDTAPAKAGTVTIEPNKGTPTASCSPDTLQYNGTAQTPDVIVLDDAGRPIPAEEYTVTVVDGPAIDPGTYHVSVMDKTGGNYEFSDTLTASFKIVPVSQNPLSITDKPASVHYGDKFVLSAIGGSGSGDIVWKIVESSIATIDKGVVTVTGTGPFTVKAYREASGGYGQSNTDTVTFYADPKPITPVVTAADKRYDGKRDATLTAKFKDGDLVGDDEVTLTVDGSFETADVGTNKKVIITSPSTAGADVGKYKITWPESTTANISRVNAEWEQEPAGAEDLAYTGDPQALLTAGTTKGSIGKVEYSTSQYSGYSTEIPTGTKAGTYTVWYRVADDVNYQGLTAESITVEIKRADPGITSIPTANSGTRGQTLDEIGFNNGGSAGVGGKFAWKDGTIQPEAGTTEQTVIFTPNDTDNYEEVEFQIPVTVTDPSGTPSTPGGSTGTPSTPPVTPGGDPSTVQTTVQNGTASTVVSAAAGSRLVQEAVENQSDSIVIKPEITGSVTRNEVTLPASTVSQIKSQTSAALTVSAPIADVTIPNAGLDTLGSAGGSVSVATEQVEQAVVLTVTANGETVNSIPGGVTLTVPAEDAGPGTVAVLVHEDGTRETVQKSMVEDGKISIPLAGSGTVEIVDNSKAFDDVQPTAWEADAVAFASARELFSGTSETTFSPTQPMSRGMLATVLYRLEGSPDQDAPASYGDVSSDAWYADGVAWATENGIANGYGDGQFGPNNNVTREQFAVMLWNYAGRPSASGQTLDFTDADQASGYALEALCWAVENGILNGYGNGKLIPGGMATRAQAAQMLKNFMENT